MSDQSEEDKKMAKIGKKYNIKLMQVSKVQNGAVSIVETGQQWLKFKLRYDWTLKDFLNLARSVVSEQSGLESARIYVSPHFQLGLGLRSSTTSKGKKRNLDFCIINSSDVPVKVSAKISLLTRFGNLWTLKKINRIELHGLKSYCVEDICSVRTIRMLSSILLKGGDLRIVIEMSIAFVSHPTLIKLDSGGVCNPALARLNSGLNSLDFEIGKLHGSRELSDITLECQGVEFPCHKVVIASRCDKFREMFRDETSRNTIEIHSIEPDVLRQLISVIYTDHLCDMSLDLHSLFRLLEASTIFKFGALKLLCERYIENRLDKDNCALILSKAIAFKCASLEFKAKKCVLDNLRDLVVTETFADLMTNYPDCLIEGR